MSNAILTIGDVMLDQFRYGSVTRINPENPAATLINIERDEFRLGGAANVAANVAAMGGESVLVGKIGEDSNGKEFRKLCEITGIRLEAIISGEPTITKTRIIERTYKQQLCRMDIETIVALSDEYKEGVRALIGELSPKLIIISDYKKGVLTEDFANAIISAGNKIGAPILVDAKPGRLGWFQGAHVIKPNFKEFLGHIGKEGLPNTNETIEQYAPALAKSLNSNLVITRSEAGASIVQANGQIYHMPTEAKDVFDVTGAGDTFIAAMAIGLAESMNLEDAARLGNKASGIAVGKVGTAVITREEFAL